MPIEFNLKKLRKNNIFVETGLRHGGGVRAAIIADFKKIYSIEILKESCDKAAVKFQKLIESGRVIIVHGKSEEKLAEIIKDIQEPITFWLDAHTPIAGDPIMCPLYKELTQIKAHPIKNHIIMIDDFDYITGTPSGRTKPPKNVADKLWYGNIYKEKIVRLILNINPDYRMFLLDKERVLYATPEIDPFIPVDEFALESFGWSVHTFYTGQPVVRILRIDLEYQSVVMM